MERTLLLIIALNHTAYCKKVAYTSGKIIAWTIKAFVFIFFKYRYANIIFLMEILRLLGLSKLIVGLFN